MNARPDNLFMNSCELTPVYLISNSGVTQGGSYILTQSSHDEQKPVTDNLKRFYENSGNIENVFLSSPKPRILKKPGAVNGNNLKLASFLLPKSESITVQNKQYVPVNAVSTVLLKPSLPPSVPVTHVTPVTHITSVSHSTPVPIPAVAPFNAVSSASPVTHVTPVPHGTITENLVPRVEIDRKIVRVGTIPNTKRHMHARALPKIKPKEIEASNPSKHTSVQLIKLGETYHSLNQLTDEQMKVVTKALKIFSDPEKTPKEPAYDPVTNTKFIYQVVSPKDLTVVGKNKVVLKRKKHVRNEELEEPAEVTVTEPKVTRSGRKVKLPRQMCDEESPQKPKKKVGSVVTCFQCSAEFCSLYRLQRHYENYPTHIPERVHSNLFHCLLAIIKGSSKDDQANIFIQQLEQLVDKLKSLLPCLLKKIDGDGKLCSINDDIGRLFGMNPGKYNLNMDALDCVKDIEGYCKHNPAPKPVIDPLDHLNADIKPSHQWLTKHSEGTVSETISEDCARTNAVDKWPTVGKRILKLKQQKLQNMNAKKVRLTSDNGDQLIELGVEDFATFSKADCVISTPQNEVSAPHNKNIDNQPEKVDNQELIDKETTSVEDQSKKPMSKPAQFRSTHFDIRSSPIKLPSALVRKFQLNPEKVTSYEVQIMRPLAIENNDTFKDSDTSLILHELFPENDDMQKVLNNDLNFDNSKEWPLNSSNDDDTSNDSYIKSLKLFDSTPLKADELQSKSSSLFSPLIHGANEPSSMIEPTLLHVKENAKGFFEPTAIHVKTDSQSLLKDNSFENALSHVKDRAKNLFEATSTNIQNHVTNSLAQSLIKSNNVFNTSNHIKDSSNNLFNSRLNNTMIGGSLLKEQSVFSQPMSQRKGDNLIQPNYLHEKLNSLIKPDLIPAKEVKSPVCVDVDSNDISENDTDNRLSSNQGQSVLNFLESMSSECLSYPETDIRNNSVDFQLDLFSFSSS